MNSPENSLIDALAKAASQNPALLKEAEARLQSWECHPGFYFSLTRIFASWSVELHLRWIAVLYVKNGVDRYWRKAAPNAISEEEKANIRDALLSSIAEPVPQIAIQKAVIISKIARFDCPREWTTLYPTLMNVVRDSSPSNALAKTRALQILAMTTKTLASKRLAGDRRMFHAISEEIFIPIAQEFEAALGSYYEELAHGEPRPYLERARYCLKILRFTSVHGFPAFGDEYPPMMLFLQNIFNEAQKFFEAGPIEDRYWEKFLILFIKVPADILENKPYAFISVITSALEFCWRFTVEVQDLSRVPAKLVVNCFNLMKNVLLCVDYKMSANSGSQRTSYVDLETTIKGNEAMALRDGFFTKTRVSDMTRKLIGSYFVLTREELETWVSDPEGYSRDDAGETSRFSLRACVECFFTALTHEFFPTVGETIMEIYRDQSLYIPSDPGDLQAVLVADAVYCAFGLAAFHLFDEIDFNELLVGTLLRQLKMEHPNYKILKNRIIWMISRWIVVRVKFELRPLLYEELLPFIGSTGCEEDNEPVETDLVLRLQAANTLKLAVDDFEFSVDQFLPFLEPTFLRLFSLLQEVRECDTKLRVLHVMSFVVERVGVHIKPFVSGLLDYLPRLWNEAVDHQMLKASIVATLVHIVDSIGRDSGTLYPFLLSVVIASTDATSPDHVYLMEDGLDLWHSVLKNAPEGNAELLAIYGRNMPGLLELGGESLKVCFKIIMGYIYMCPEQFVRTYGQSMGTYFGRMTTELKRDGILAMVRLTELSIRALPHDAPPMFRSFVEWMVYHTLSDAETSVAPILTSSIFAVISRVILFCPDMIKEIIQSVASGLPLRVQGGDPGYQFFADACSSGQIDPGVVWGRLIDLWVMKFSTFVSPAKRKVMAAAFASLLPSTERVFLERFCGILMCAAETLADISECEDLSGVMHSLAISEDNADTPFAEVEGESWSQEETPHDERKRQFGLRDPMSQVPLKSFIQNQITTLQQKIGPENYQVLLTSVDSETMRSAKEYFTL